MAVRRYRDFILIVECSGPDADGSPEQVTVSVFDSPVGQGERKEQVRIPASLAQMERWLDSRRLDRDLSKQIELGETIAAVLLPPYARKMFGESLVRLPADEGLRVRLRVGETLANIPWEFAYIQRTAGERAADGFLALDPRVSIVRHEALAVPGDWFETPASRRVLVAMASPKPYEKYPKLESLPQEQQQIRKALDAVGGVDAVFLPTFAEADAGGNPGVTVKQLAEALMERADVFHFSGHGEFARELTTQEGEGALLFSDASGEAFPVSAAKLAELLKSKGVRLAVLGACEGGRRDGKNAWSGVAAALLRVGIPAVVAMQYTIDDKLAAAFMTSFYKALVAGRLVDEAVAAGRMAIRLEAANFQEDIRDWGVPVLYLRSPEGAVFNPVSNDAAARQAGEGTEAVVEQRVRTLEKAGRMIGAVVDSLGAGATVAIDQKAEQEVKGFMLGASVFTMEGGTLKVKMQADVVSGTIVAARIGRIGAGAPRNAEQVDTGAVAQLEKFLKLA
jgi:hypothetical protein